MDATMIDIPIDHHTMFLMVITSIIVNYGGDNY